MNKPNSPKIENNLKGAYEFNIQSVLKQGWKNTLGSLNTFVPMLFVLLGILLGLALVYVKTQGMESAEQINYESINMFDLVVRVLLAPLFAALMMHGVKVQLNQTRRVSDLFEYFPQMLALCLSSIIISLMTLVGMALFLIPGMYVVMSTGFAMMLVADKKLTPFKAIALSMTMVNRYLVKFIGLYLLLLIFFIAGLLTYGIGLILFLPFYYNVKGILYVELFADAKDKVNNVTEIQSEGSFEA